MHKRPSRSPGVHAQARVQEMSEWQAKMGLYLGLLALYALGKMWPT